MSVHALDIARLRSAVADALPDTKHANLGNPGTSAQVRLLRGFPDAGGQENPGTGGTPEPPDAVLVRAASGPSCAWPTLEQRPCYRVHEDPPGDGRCPGLWFHGLRDGRGDAPATPIDQRVGPPIYVVARTADEHGARGFGKRVRFRDALGRERQWSMPAVLLAGDGVELLRELLDQGYEPDADGAKLLRRYLLSAAPNVRLVSCSRTGWQGGGSAFVFPDTTIGSADYLFQSDVAPTAPFGVGGTLDGWREEVAGRCIGNPLLMLSVSGSFCGPIMARIGLEHGGIHFYGSSSGGKTTGLKAACATFGGEDYRRSWRTTANGLEGAAALANDVLLPLDELGEAEPDDVGGLIYALGNGVGKTRADRAGRARVPARWRAFVVSSGEQSIAETIRDASRGRVHAGQLVRVLDIPADDGLIRVHPGSATPGAFAEALTVAALEHYGHAGRAFIAKLIDERDRDLAAEFGRIVDHPGFRQSEGQARRAARILAAVGMAGELATEYGFTGWPKGAALDAARMALASWLAARGTNGQAFEHAETLRRVRDWLASHGEAGFTALGHDRDIDTAPAGRERLGWYRGGGDARTWYVLPRALDTALKGVNRKAAVEHLHRAGWIVEHDGDRRQKKIHTPIGKQNVYALRPVDDDAEGNSDA